MMSHLSDVADLEGGAVIQFILRRKVELLNVSGLDVLWIRGVAGGDDRAVVDSEAILLRERRPAAGRSGRDRSQRGGVGEGRIIDQPFPGRISLQETGGPISPADHKPRTDLIGKAQAGLKLVVGGLVATRVAAYD